MACLGCYLSAHLKLETTGGEAVGLIKILNFTGKHSMFLNKIKIFWDAIILTLCERVNICTIYIFVIIYGGGFVFNRVPRLLSQRDFNFPEFMIIALRPFLISKFSLELQSCRNHMKLWPERKIFKNLMYESLVPYIIVYGIFVFTNVL